MGISIYRAVEGIELARSQTQREQMAPTRWERSRQHAYHFVKNQETRPCTLAELLRTTY